MTEEHGGNADDFASLLAFLRSQRAFDFTGYKRASLQRRIQRRMQDVDVESFAAYEDYLEVHPDEFVALFNTVLINVTSFFRDPETWEHLRREILPRIVAAHGPDEPIRVWSAGCATGQEAYSVAMLLAEELGMDELRRRVKIYATDVDDDALAQARQARYRPEVLAALPEGYAERYLVPEGDGVLVAPELRRAVIFGRHDLVQDAPISRIDLLVCRNTLMYFNAETQRRILSRLHFALREHGYLFLGRVEMLVGHPELFTPVAVAQRIFVKVQGEGLRARLRSMSADAEGDDLESAPDGLPTVAFERLPVASLLLDARNLVVAANARARTLLRVRPADVGRPFQDLDASFRPVELRSHLERAHATGQAVVVEDATLDRDGEEPRALRIELVPLHSRSGALLGAHLAFFDVTDHVALREQLHVTNEQLSGAMEELQSANEELETTNEELQSTNEELETTNEELQSANEELETMNAELQSTNAELQAMNDELSASTGALDEVNAYLESILATLDAAVVVVDDQMRIRTWNDEARELWGVAFDDVVGVHLADLDTGLPVGELVTSVSATLADGKDNHVVVDALDRRGRPLRCGLRSTPLRTRGGDLRGAILLMEATDRKA